jgi:hypothetical protein
VPLPAKVQLRPRAAPCSRGNNSRTPFRASGIQNVSKKLYIIDTGFTDSPNNPSHIRVFDVDVENGKVSNSKVFADMPKPSITDGMRTEKRRHRLPHSMTSSAMLSNPDGEGETERLGGLEIDDEFKSGGLLHGKVTGLLTFEKMVLCKGRVSPKIAIARAVPAVSHRAMALHWLHIPLRDQQYVICLPLIAAYCVSGDRARVHRRSDGGDRGAGVEDRAPP